MRPSSLLLLWIACSVILRPPPLTRSVKKNLPPFAFLSVTWYVMLPFDFLYSSDTPTGSGFLYISSISSTSADFYTWAIECLIFDGVFFTILCIFENSSPSSFSPTFDGSTILLLISEGRFKPDIFEVIVFAVAIAPILVGPFNAELLLPLAAPVEGVVR